MKAKAKTNGHHRKGSFSVETPGPLGERRLGAGYFGKSLESIIAGVAVERTEPTKR
jgi:hypothetical protein